jgi:hypothetical protein
VNGEKQITQVREQMPSRQNHTFEGLWIAGHPIEESPNRVAYLYSGGMDEIRISRICRYRDNFKPELRFNTDADTLVLYHCDEGMGDELKDSSGNSHHARIIKANWKPRSDR